jgi:hypothetical protein
LTPKRYNYLLSLHLMLSPLLRHLLLLRLAQQQQ